MDQSVIELNQKVDALCAQVAYLTEQAQVAERQRQSRDELIHDLTPIADEAYRLTITQLEEIQDYIDISDLLRLFKRVLRNGRNLEKMLDQLESLADLAETVSPLADEAFGKAVDTLNGMEQKGYFGFARGAGQLLESGVSAFSEQDLAAFGDNLIPLLKIITRPQTMGFLRGAFESAETELQQPLNTSLMALLRQLNDPAVRRGLALSLSMLHAIGAQVPSNKSN